MQKIKAPIVLMIGTRPEGIKMAPVYYALKDAGLPVVVCSTMQHDKLLQEVLELFAITPDFNLAVMRPGQDLFYLTQSILQKTKEVFLAIKPSLVLVQGDTTSSMAAALAAFYLNIPIGHIEAGLRTGDMHDPFPEEFNRRMISLVARYHFAPTGQAVDNLVVQGINRDHVYRTGNTVVDALHMVKEKINSGKLAVEDTIIRQVAACKRQNKKIIILTMHRRESLNYGIYIVLRVLKTFLQDRPDVFCFYPYHPNPRVLDAIDAVGLNVVPNIYLSEPLLYKDMVYVLDAADLVLTDSGGLQEEAVSLAKPVLVLRQKTERTEGVSAGFAHIVGTDGQAITAGLTDFLDDPSKTLKQQSINCYGDGDAAYKIASIIQSEMATLSSKKFLAATKMSKSQSINMQAKKGTNMGKVSVLGLGYIGLPTAIVLADSGFEVTGVDIDKARVDQINSGDPVIHEPAIYEKLQIALGSGNFRATTIIEPADYFIIAVPTPLTKEKKADLQYVFAASESIASVLQKGNVVMLESTVPVGTTQKVAAFLQEKTDLKAGSNFFVAHSPERVLPGNIFSELVHNDRIIGGINKESVTRAKQLYKPFVKGCLYLTNAETAEMVKLVENSSRDAQLAFAHQVASIAQSAGLNPYEVIELANKHPRVHILQPTCGVGGHCIAVDPWFLAQGFSKQAGLIKTIRQVNDNKPLEVIQSIKRAIAEYKREKKNPCTLLLLGLTYKPDVDDLRESPALRIAQMFSEDDSSQLLVSEPHVKKEQLAPFFSKLPEIVSITDGLQRADVVAFLVSHTAFKAIDFKLLYDKKLLDFCGVLYRSRQAVQDEVMFWPAQGIMDFFIVNQSHKLPENDEKIRKERRR